MPRVYTLDEHPRASPAFITSRPQLLTLDPAVQLESAGIAPIQPEQLASAMSKGVCLLQLVRSPGPSPLLHATPTHAAPWPRTQLEHLEHHEFRKFDRNPSTIANQLDNLSMALSYVTQASSPFSQTIPRQVASGSGSSPTGS
jgi:hypothetical protein